MNVNEDVTVTVNDGDSEDVLGDDTNAYESASLSVSALRTGSTEGNGTGSTLGSALTGTYGQLTLNANGSYTYVTNQSAADDLDAGDTATDAFNYTVSDGTATDTATLTFTITGVNDTPVGVNDTDYINEEETLTVSNGRAAVSGTVSGSNTGDIVSNDTDVDDSASLSGSGSVVSSGTSNSSSIGSAVVGTYGTLTLNANGSYSYVSNQSAADDLKKGETGSDVFTYTVSDGTDTDTATLTINVLGLDENISVVTDEKKELTKKNHTITVLPKTVIGQVLPANFIVNQDSFFVEQTT